MTRQEGLLIVEQKVDDFNKNENIYLSKTFQETEARNRFIDPLFTALGWELEQTHLNRQFWDVHREFSQRDDSSTKKPDYAFRIKDNGSNHNKFREKFFVEAKAPWVPLTDAKPVFQAKRYAFSSHGKAPIVILTDFQEFRVFNGLQRPRFDNPLQGLIGSLDLRYTEYMDKWDLIWENFSKEAVTDGSIDRLIGKIAKSTKTLDDEFLSDITGWREALAKNIANRNKNLSVDEINEAVQRILDRFVFIRNLEDRNIEDENLLYNLINRKEDEDAHFYKCIVPVFRRLDTDYNGLLFKKHFSENLDIDNKVVKDIIKSMCYPDSPFQFDIIEPEILGRIYERFLGSKIRLTEDHRAKVEEKPEVRHAGGVYYTPEYIVKYIVENTVGEKIKGLTPEEIENIKILDPACGSGSFLLGAFDYLVETHKKFYAQNKKSRKYKDDFYETPDGEIRLTLQKKGQILKNNIFGVDIDREATEVAIMSLYLKLLDEGFDKGQAMLFMKGHILPDMTANVKCGNSLIGSDFYDDKDLSLFERDDMKEVNAFDWEKEFADIFKKGGFDCVIGNPPYLFIVELNRNEKDYFSKYYTTCEYRFDVYGLFIEISVNRLLRNNGKASFIIPHTLLSNDSFEKLRKLLLDESFLELIVDIGPGVFQNAKNETMIFVLKKCSIKKDNDFLTTVILASSKSFPIPNMTYEINQNIWKNNNKYSIQVNTSPGELLLIEKIENDKIRLGDICTINQGLRTGDNDKFLSNECKSDLWKKAVGGSEVSRYLPLCESFYVYYEPNVLDAPRKREIFESNEKIIVQEIRNITLPRRIIATYDDKKFYCLQSTNVLNIRQEYNSNISMKYILAILNSNLINYFFKNKFSGNNHIASNQLAQIPIIDSDYSTKNNLITLVDQIFASQKKVLTAKTDQDKSLFNRQIEMIDKQIDKLVYELYGLTEEDIKVVEGKE